MKKGRGINGRREVSPNEEKKKPKKWVNSVTNTQARSSKKTDSFDGV